MLFLFSQLPRFVGKTTLIRITKMQLCFDVEFTINVTQCYRSSRWKKVCELLRCVFQWESEQHSRARSTWQNCNTQTTKTTLIQSSYVMYFVLCVTKMLVISYRSLSLKCKTWTHQVIFLFRTIHFTEIYSITRDEFVSPIFFERYVNHRWDGLINWHQLEQIDNDNEYTFRWQLSICQVLVC